MTMLKYIVIAVIAIIVIAFIAFSTAKTVPEGHVGILLTYGKADTQSVPPGLKFVVPFVQDVVLVNTQNIKTTVNIAAASKDLQTVSGTVAVNTIINPNVAVKIYSQLGMGYQASIIEPAVQEAVKQATAKFPVNQLLNDRESLKNMALQQIKQRLATYNITVADVSIIDLNFSEKVNAAIEAAATEQQNVQTALNAEKRIKIEANQTVAKAEGEQRALVAQAEANKQQSILQAEATKQQTILQSQGIAEATELQAQAEANKTLLIKQAESKGIELVNQQLAKNPLYIEYLKANKWSGNLPNTLLGTGNQTATLLNIAPK